MVAEEVAEVAEDCRQAWSTQQFEQFGAVGSKT